MIAVRRIVYRHVRRAYHEVANRGYARDRNALAALLRTFVKRGDLVFDVGANRGDYTYVMLSLGAKVVAVEPNPYLAEQIRTRYPVAVESVAIGAARGRMPLHLGIDPGHSTVSNDWLAAAPTTDRWSGRTVDVDVVTLDDLAARYGTPRFVKVDVEGYEVEVFRGCSQPPPALSFEFQGAALPVASELLALLDESYEFNHITAEEPEFRHSWCDASQLRARLAAYESSQYGDVYARRLD